MAPGLSVFGDVHMISDEFLGGGVGVSNDTTAVVIGVSASF